MDLRERNRKPFTDIHCHILHGVDDGAKTLEEALLALEQAEKQGVKKIILTPHHAPEDGLSPERILKMAAQLRQAALDKGISVDLHTGQECLYHSELPGLLEQGEVLTLARSRYVLVAFQEEISWFMLRSGCAKLQEYGFVPILAHYERYRCMDTGNRAAELKRMGCLLQVNAETISRFGGRLFYGNPIRRDIRQGLVDFVGSDCHGTHFRPYQLPKQLAWLYRACSMETADAVTWKNAEKILEKKYV